ncbi:MAG TPA: anti-sigma factor [Acidimicrobiales bacterium]
MATDDDRVAELAGDEGDLDPIERAQLEELRVLLADPAVWAEPDPELEDIVVSAIAAEAGTSRAPRNVVPLARKNRRPWLYALAGAAAAAIIALVAVVAFRDTGSTAEQFTIVLQSGRAEFTRTDSGWRIYLEDADLPRLDNGRFYEAWLRKGDVLVPVGTFNEGQQVTLWAGVSPKDYTTFTVTREAADGNQASSGDRVLSGTITP